MPGLQLRRPCLSDSEELMILGGGGGGGENGGGGGACTRLGWVTSRAAGC